jgi:hypothetical protein
MQPQIANVPTERGMPDNDNNWAELGGKVRDTGNASNMPWYTDNEMLSTDTSIAQGLASSTNTSTGSPTIQITGIFLFKFPFAT